MELLFEGHSGVRHEKIREEDYPVSHVSFNPGCFSRCPKDVNVDPAEVAKKGRY